MNGKKTTIQSKLKNIELNKSKRLMGFREWCELVWNPKSPIERSTVP
jgi:hypothetical protein